LPFVYNMLNRLISEIERGEVKYGI
jgi:hypothetical protein